MPGSRWPTGPVGPLWNVLHTAPWPSASWRRDPPVSRPAVAQHLKVLKSAGLVRDRAAGTRRVYQLEPTGLAALRADLDRFWAQALATYADIVDQMERGRS